MIDSPQKITKKETKYESLLEDIQSRGWKVVITVGTKGAIHDRIKNHLEEDSQFGINKSITKKTLKAILMNAIKYIMHIVFTKRRIKRKQPLPIELP